MIEIQEQIRKELQILHDSVQAMREDGGTDLRSVLSYINEARRNINAILG